VKLHRILLNSFSVQNLSVMLACIQILVVMLRQGDLLLVISELQIRNIILDRLQNILSFCSLLLTLLLLLFTQLTAPVDLALHTFSDQAHGRRKGRSREHGRGIDVLVLLLLGSGG